MSKFSFSINLDELQKKVQEAISGERNLNDVNKELEKSYAKVAGKVTELKNKMEKMAQATDITNALKAQTQALEEVSRALNRLREDITSTNQRLEEMSQNFGKGSSGKEDAKNIFTTQAEALEKLGLKADEFAQSLKDQDKAWTMTKSSINTADGTITEYKNSVGSTVKVVQKLVDEEARYSATLTEVNKALKKNADAASDRNSAYKSREEVLEKLGIDNLDDFKLISKDMDTFGNSVERYTNNAGKMVTITGKLIDGQEVFAGKVKIVTSSLDKNSKQAKGWAHNWAQAWKSFTAFQLISDVFYKAKAAIKDMVENVTELDSSLLELRKVTDLEGEALDEFVTKAYEAGKTVAKTGREMIEAATSFAKAGYDSELALQLGRVAAMYTNIADEAIDAADAADMVIAQMKAFDMDETEASAMRIIDVINEVSNNFAVSSSDIANNLGKASAVMANAGNTYEQMVAIMTAGTEVTRSATKVANGKKIKPYIYRDMYINTIPNPVTLKALIATA